MEHALRWGHGGYPVQQCSARVQHYFLTVLEVNKYLVENIAFNMFHIQHNYHNPPLISTPHTLQTKITKGFPLCDYLFLTTRTYSKHTVH